MAKTKVPDPEWLGQEEVQRRAIALRKAWDEWIESPYMLPTENMLDGIDNLLFACGAPYNAPEDRCYVEIVDLDSRSIETHGPMTAIEAEKYAGKMQSPSNTCHVKIRRDDADTKS